MDTAVNEDIGSRDVVGQVGREKQTGVGDVFRFGQAIERDSVEVVDLLSLLLDKGFRSFDPRQAGRDAVARDPVRRERGGEPAGDAGHTGFGPAVDRHRGDPEPGGDTGDVDDPSGLQRPCPERLGEFPGSDEQTAEVCGVTQRLREEPLLKQPGVAETLDWARAVATLRHDGDGALTLTEIETTLGCLLKEVEDIERVDETLIEALLESAKSARASGEA